MKYIDYVNDWFALYINPLDYDNDANRFIQHIFATLPLLDKLTLSAELSALKDVIMLNAQILIQSIETDTQHDAIDVFSVLKEQINKLKGHIRSYAASHFDELCLHDPFYQNFQDYLRKSAIKLSTAELNAVKDSYIQLYLEAQAVELTSELAARENMDELLAQTKIDQNNMVIEKLQFIGKVRGIMLDSQTCAKDLKSAIQQNMLSFCQFVEESTSEKLKFDTRHMKRLTSKFINEHFHLMRSIEKIINELKVDELVLQGLVEQEQSKQRSQANLEIIQQHIANKKLKIATAETAFAQTQIQLEQAFVAFYQSVFRFPASEDLKAIIAMYKIEDLLTAKQAGESLLDRGYSLLGLVTGAFDRYLPSQMDLQLGAVGLAAGALAIGAGPLGIAAGVSVGIAAVKTGRKVNQFVNIVSDEYQGLKQAWQVKFLTIYQSSDYQVTDALTKTCENDAVKAQVINAFYVRSMFNFDLQLSDMAVIDQQPTEQAIKIAKSQFEKHYQQLRKGNIKAKDFWDKTFFDDIAVRVAHLQLQCAQHTAGYIKSLNEYFAVKQADSLSCGMTNQIQLHRCRLDGIREELALLKRLHDRQAWRRLREQDTSAYRQLTKLPQDFTYEDHVDQLILNGQSAHLLFWLQEQAVNPRRKMAEPLLRYQGKSIWHLLAELENGHDLYRQMMDCSATQDETRFGSKLIAGVKSFFKQFQNNQLFDLSIVYNEMNPLAYAFEHGNISLLRAYLEQMLQHPSNASRIGTRSLFAFILKSHPEIGLILDVQKQSVLTTLTNKLIQRTSLELCLMAAFTICLAKGEKIPTTKEQWVVFINELKHRTSSYIHVKVFLDFDNQQVQACAQTLSKVSTVPAITMNKQTPLVEYLAPETPLLLVGYLNKVAENPLSAVPIPQVSVPKAQRRL